MRVEISLHRDQELHVDVKVQSLNLSTPNNLIEAVRGALVKCGRMLVKAGTCGDGYSDTEQALIVVNTDNGATGIDAFYICELSDSGQQALLTCLKEVASYLAGYLDACSDMKRRAERNLGTLKGFSHESR